jgi:dTDP-4-dehydrorhamnose 3,5-epimerase
VTFAETSLPGAMIVEMEKRSDDRGFFARVFCAREMAAIGLNPDAVQINVSYNKDKGTLRGMHYQIAPATETKLVRCTRGAILDVIIDMRPDSPTYLQHIKVELTAENHRALYVPGMFAHGYITLTDDTEICYVVSEYYTPGCERGARWDDPAFGIEWPLKPIGMSGKDAVWPLMSERMVDESQ